jgi:hypothetical protein
MCVLKYDTKTYDDVGQNEGIAPHILNLGARCRWVTTFVAQPLYCRYVLERKLSGHHNQSRRCIEENTATTLPGIKPRLLDRIVRSLITKVTELSRFHVPLKKKEMWW